VRREGKERAIHSPANSNLPGRSIARKKERILLFINRGKIPLFYKKQYQERKSKRKGHNFKKNPQKEKPF